MARDVIGAEWLSLVRTLACGCCGAPAPSYAHHIREGQGMAQRADDFLAVPLCHDCHQGQHGIHGDRQRWVQHKVDELTVLAATIRVIYRLTNAPF